MKTYKRTVHQNKILDALDKVYDKLIKFKKKNNSELIVLENNKIVRIKP